MKCQIDGCSHDATIFTKVTYTDTSEQSYYAECDECYISAQEYSAKEQHISEQTCSCSGASVRNPCC